MRLFWISLALFYAFINPKHLTVTAASTSLPFDNPGVQVPVLSNDQNNLVKALSAQIYRVLKDMNGPEYSLEADDLPLVQNVSNVFEAESLTGSLLMFNTAIDGLSETEDAIDVVKDKHEIRMTVTVKQLVIHGEFIQQTVTEEPEEIETYSVTLTNVRMEGVASLLADPIGNLQVTNVDSTVMSEESLVKMKSKNTPSPPILEWAIKYLQKNIEKRFARIAFLEVYMHYPRKNEQTLSEVNQTMFEAQRFVSQRHDPHRFKMISMGDTSASSWSLGPFRLYGFANFHLEELDFIISNTSVSIIVRILTNGLYGNFPFFLQQRYTGAYTIEKMDLIGKIELVADGSASSPIIKGLGMEMTGCKCRFRNKATGARAGEIEFGFDAEDLFCLLIRNEISTASIVKTVQAEIFNKIDVNTLKDRIVKVLYEDKLMSEAY